MIRQDLTPAVQDALGADSLQALPLVHLDIQGDPVFAWGGTGTLHWDGMAFEGVGRMGEIAAVRADARGGVPNLSMALSGLEPDLLQAVHGRAYQGRRGRLWLACFRDDMALIGQPLLQFAGEISAMRLVDGGTDRRVQVTIESRLRLLQRVLPRFRTHEDHQRDAPGDRFFEFVTDVTSKTVYWGLRAPSGPGSVNAPGPGARGADPRTLRRF
ncbi:hypothetical protein [Yunchengibacter salinarum]|uniref:hypothetical protein n=1 Tax=Yunchengibacter salinarum TaxID=3133399 RepID=UPI0035B57C07